MTGFETMAPSCYGMSFLWSKQVGSMNFSCVNNVKIEGKPIISLILFEVFSVLGMQ